jgi:hypothetical protein
MRPERFRAVPAALAFVAALLVPVAVAGVALGTRTEARPAPTEPTVPVVAPPEPDAAEGEGENPRDAFADSAAPLREADAADPFIAVDGQPWLFTTNNTAGNVPVVTGTVAQGADGVAVADALPDLPAWAADGFTWAPAVTQTDHGWVLAFTAQHAASGRQCIGVATSPVIDGPYTPRSEPLVCDLARGGSIDPSFVVDDQGEQWLLYKDDGNCCGLATTLHAAPLTADATALAGSPSDLLSADQSWEGGLIEAPSMQHVDGRWLLLYSANQWDSPDYAVGAAWCESPAGPCEKQDAPVLTSGSGLDGPGGVEFVSDPAQDRVPIVTFHAWPAGEVGDGDGSTRRLQIGRVELDGDRVTISPVARAPR